MSTLQQLFEGFHSAILDKDVAQIVSAIKPNPRIPPTQQLAIYINGYRYRLIDAIKSDYPALLHYVGEKPFEKLAINYIETTPPQHFNLDRYPHAFVKTIEQQSTDFFAIDMARLEAGIAQVFMGEESQPLPANHLSQVTIETLAEMRLSPRHASLLLRFDHPANRYLLQMREGNAPEKPAPNACYLYLVRHNNEVARHELSEPEYLIMNALCKGNTVGAAIESTAELHPEHVDTILGSLQNWFANWIASGYFRI